MNVRNSPVIPLLFALAGSPLHSAPPPWPPPGEPQVTDICTVVKDPKRFNNKYVEVSGIWFFDSGGISNPKCDRMVVDGYAWPPGLHMAIHRMSDSEARAYHETFSKAIEEVKRAGSNSL